MARYKVLRGFCLKPGQDVYPGDVVEFDKEFSAKLAITSGKVVLIEEGSGEAPPSSGEGEGSEQKVGGDSANPETREPHTRRRG